MYKQTGTKIKFYSVTTGILNTRDSKYSDYNDDEHELNYDMSNVKVDLDLSSRKNASYKLENAKANKDSFKTQGEPETKHYKHRNETKVDTFVLTLEGELARLQTACMLYKRNPNDPNNPFILMYYDNGHLDIPHSGVGENDATYEYYAKDTVKRETGLSINTLHRANFDYYYFENASGYLRDVQDTEKWYHYYNILFVNDLTDTTDSIPVREATENCIWISAKKLFTTHAGTSCHIKPIIYNALKDEGIDVK